jgi:hypothetical protein
LNHYRQALKLQLRFRCDGHCGNQMNSSCL